MCVAGRRTQPPQGAEGDEAAWFAYYSGRMGARRRVRRLMRLYVPFLLRSSQMALMPGASPRPPFHTACLPARCTIQMLKEV